MAGGRVPARSAHGHRRAGRPQADRGSARDARRGARDRPPGQISGCGRARHGSASGATGPPRRPYASAGAVHADAERPGRRRALHPRPRARRAGRRGMNQHFAAHDDQTIRITRLENGFTIVTETMPHVATATLGVWVGAGSRHERAGEHGLSHLIEHMAFKGTRRRSARRIAEDIENVGGEINAATSVEFTNYTARVLGETIGVALDVLGDILTESSFEESELAREKGVILQEYAAVEDDPDDLVFDAFMETAFAGQAIGRPILGRPETIKSFDGGTIRAFMAREYAPERMVLAAAGDVRHDGVLAAAERHFGALPEAPRDGAAPASYTGGERRMQRRLEQASLVLGLPGCSFKDPVYYATHMFAHVLGGGLTSRLWHEVCEQRGL